ncbi:MAG: FAD-linked oxidase C-terminal domain-containing protein [bacterium]
MKSSLIKEFRKILGQDRCLHSPEDLYAYSHDCYARGKPELVLLPRTTQEVSSILRLAHREAIPVTPRGAGSSLCGATTPIKGGIVLATNQMNRILEVSQEDRLAVLEPGVVTLRLHQAVEAVGLFYPPDPASYAMSLMGGNVATNAGGPRCLKYGVTRDYLLGLEVVLADGEVLHTGSRAVKDVTGYDLTRLFCGSEGTLGVITRITVRLIPKPETKRTILASLGTVEEASRMVSRIIGAGILPTTLEFMDQAYIRTVEELMHLGLPLDAGAMLLIEVDGFEEAVERQARIVEQFCREHGALDVAVAKNSQESEELWRGRRMGTVALMRAAKLMISHDATVPASSIPSLVAHTHEVARQADLKVVIIGHAGDGNMHPIFLLDPSRPQEMERFQEASRELFRFTVEHGGTLSGEHGIGLEKNPYLHLQVNPIGMRTMKAIKKALDPKGILNPGKFV